MRFLLSNDEIVINADIINFSDSDGNTALHLVICKNKNGGSTFLHSVVMRDNNYDSTKFKAIINSCDASELTTQDNDGNTPLHLACNRRSMNMVVELCNSMTNPDDFLIRNNQGQTAYDISRFYGTNQIDLATYIDDRFYKLSLLYENDNEEVHFEALPIFNRII